METEKLPIAHLYRKVLFPFCNLSITSGLSVFSRVKSGDRVLAFPVRNVWDLLFPRDRIATLSEVVEVKREEDVSTIQLKGIRRIRLKKVVRFFHGLYAQIQDEDGAGNEKLREELRKKSQELVFLINVEESDKLIHLLNFLVDMRQLTDFISNYFVLKFPRRFQIYEEVDVTSRAKILISVLDSMIEEMKKKRKEKEYEEKPEQ